MARGLRDPKTRSLYSSAARVGVAGAAVASFSTSLAVTPTASTGKQRRGAQVFAGASRRTGEILGDIGNRVAATLDR
jgi:hypothetical protein